MSVERDREKTRSLPDSEPLIGTVFLIVAFFSYLSSVRSCVVVQSMLHLNHSSKSNEWIRVCYH